MTIFIFSSIFIIVLVRVLILSLNYYDIYLTEVVFEVMVVCSLIIFFVLNMFLYIMNGDNIRYLSNYTDYESVEVVEYQHPGLSTFNKTTIRLHLNYEDGTQIECRIKLSNVEKFQKNYIKLVLTDINGKSLYHLNGPSRKHMDKIYKFISEEEIDKLRTTK